ncbi:MAG TPA: hypothetical protein VFU29_13830 [Chitinophagaceae bacterium]|nr:hypothetical protein [Chitinophagaceae bacterium]
MPALFSFSELIMVSEMANEKKKDISKSVIFITIIKMMSQPGEAYATGTKRYQDQNISTSK